MLKIQYAHICDQCSAEIFTENYTQSNPRDPICLPTKVYDAYGAKCCLSCLNRIAEAIRKEFSA